MKFQDSYFSREDRYSLGIEIESQMHYVSIPVSNGIVDYEEYYQITAEQYQTFLENRPEVIAFVESCRRRERDEFLIQKPGRNRGTPV